MPSSPYQIIVFGATSFVGQILCRYLWQRHGAEGEVKWAMAGRSRAKLEQVRQQLGEGASAVPLIVADAADEAALRTLCEQTRVVISTVGPYALYGSPLVKVCAETGTDYCDLTGEVPWMAQMIAAHEATAKQTGARIVHTCGFDSVPSDLGVQFLQDAAYRQFNEPCTTIHMRIAKLRGGLSGGTVASMLNMMREMEKDPSVKRVLTNPFVLTPEGRGVRQDDVKFVAYDSEAESWLAPFVMASINTRVVHRTNALIGARYGKEFRYDEAMMTGRGLAGQLRAVGMASGLAGFLVASSFRPTRNLLERHVVPKPGEGPSPQSQERGCYDLRFRGATAKGQKLVAKVTGDRDPGYGSTAKMLGEAGACLALDIPKEEFAGGFWTPAALMGERLRKRLIEHAGLTFDVIT
ncbi:MAG: saccharopine dehydrogenase NADP-binding domain-containing protein [Burkholderiales bacterium]|nr:saccharopine dehydrogenase NADP-binding domain-containing protein [Burkholderiales bacterium]MDE2431724.1 saccharopine dehydrogenase NADP-binding domain-containing protein [Burkholderiales bacterium]